jgi:predicted nucleotidyltransferase
MGTVGEAMGMADRIIEVLRAAAGELAADPAPATEAGVVSVAVIGSVARGDFVEGGSDLDLLMVHTHGERPAREIAAIPALRRVLRRFGGPVLDRYGGTGSQKPFMVDLGFVDYEVLRQQPDWADPTRFREEHTERNTYLWLYAFDLAAHRIRLFGEDPMHHVVAYPPSSYAPWELARCRAGLDRARRQMGERDGLADEAVSEWKKLAGAVLRLAALTHGGRSLRKAEVYRDFQQAVPLFEGKGFAEVLWVEYLRGDPPEDRSQWLAQCDRFCAGALDVIAWAAEAPPPLRSRGERRER